MSNVVMLLPRPQLERVRHPRVEASGSLTSAQRASRRPQPQPEGRLHFAKRLKAIMAERGLTQSDVAAKIWGRSRNAKGALVANGRDRLSVWASGKNFPDRKNLMKLARAFGVEVSDLAPEAELERAHRGAANWSFTQPADGSDLVLVQIAKFVTPRIAHEIQGLLLKDQELQRTAASVTDDEIAQAGRK